MADIPYGELQYVDVTVKDENGEQHIIDKLHYAYVVPCVECRFYAPNEQGTLGGCTLLDFCTAGMEHGFCAWGERRES